MYQLLPSSALMFWDAWVHESLRQNGHRKIQVRVSRSWESKIFETKAWWNGEDLLCLWWLMTDRPTFDWPKIILLLWIDVSNWSQHFSRIRKTKSSSLHKTTQMTTLKFQGYSTRKYPQFCWKYHLFFCDLVSNCGNYLSKITLRKGVAPLNQKEHTNFPCQATRLMKKNPAPVEPELNMATNDFQWSQRAFKFSDFVWPYRWQNWLPYFSRITSAPRSVHSLAAANLAFRFARDKKAPAFK